MPEKHEVWDTFVSDYIMLCAARDGPPLCGAIFGWFISSVSSNFLGMAHNSFTCCVIQRSSNPGIGLAWVTRLCGKPNALEGNSLGRM